MRHAGLGDEMHFSFNKVEELNYARMGDSVTDWFSLFFFAFVEGELCLYGYFDNVMDEKGK